FVGRAWADQVHVGAKVLAVLACPIASTVGAEAEVGGNKLFGSSVQLGEKIATLITGPAFNGARVVRAPEALPFCQGCEEVPSLSRVIKREMDIELVDGVKILVLLPGK